MKCESNVLGSAAVQVLFGRSEPRPDDSCNKNLPLIPLIRCSLNALMFVPSLSWQMVGWGVITRQFKRSLETFPQSRSARLEPAMKLEAFPYLLGV